MFLKRTLETLLYREMIAVQKVSCRLSTMYRKVDVEFSDLQDEPVLADAVKDRYYSVTSNIHLVRTTTMLGTSGVALE